MFVRPGLEKRSDELEHPKDGCGCLEGVELEPGHLDSLAVDLAGDTEIPLRQEAFVAEGLCCAEPGVGRSGGARYSERV
jgi:hypothetical protein